MLANIQFPDIELEPEPTSQELLELRRTIVDRHSLGSYKDIMRIEDLPQEVKDNLHYEWHTTSLSGDSGIEAENRLALLGFKRNDSLAARSKYINPDKSNGNMIGDLACYTIHKKKKQMMDEAFEIQKQMKADPRKSYSEITKQMDGDFLPLPEKEIRENKSQIISGIEAASIAKTDWIKSTQTNKD